MIILERLLETKDSEFLRAPLIGIGMKNHFGFCVSFLSAINHARYSI